MGGEGEGVWSLGSDTRIVDRREFNSSLLLVLEACMR